MKRRPSAMPIEEWLLLNREIDPDTGCWVWTRAKITQGYGHVRLPGGGPILVHRLAHKLWIGEIPEGLLVCHHCDNPPCFNPEHIYSGTRLDNSADCVRRGRLIQPMDRHHTKNRARGEGHPMTKTTTEQVLAIRDDPRGATAVARDYGLHPTTVHRIRSKRTWGHVA